MVFMANEENSFPRNKYQSTFLQSTSSVAFFKKKKNTFNVKIICVQNYISLLLSSQFPLIFAHTNNLQNGQYLNAENHDNYIQITFRKVLWISISPVWSLAQKYNHCTNTAWGKSKSMASFLLLWVKKYHTVTSLREREQHSDKTGPDNYYGKISVILGWSSAAECRRICNMQDSSAVVLRASNMKKTLRCEVRCAMKAGTCKFHWYN